MFFIIITQQNIIVQTLLLVMFTKTGLFDDAQVGNDYSCENPATNPNQNKKADVLKFVHTSDLKQLLIWLIRHRVLRLYCVYFSSKREFSMAVDDHAKTSKISAITLKSFAIKEIVESSFLKNSIIVMISTLRTGVISCILKIAYDMMTEMS